MSLFYIDANGYRRVKMPGHHRADKAGYVKEHIFLAEKLVGRPISVKEHVHHTDLCKGKINPFGLVVFNSRTEHNKYHANLRALNDSGHSGYRKCQYCKKYDDPNNMQLRDRGYKGKDYFHLDCRNDYQFRYRRAGTKMKVHLAGGDPFAKVGGSEHRYLGCANPASEKAVSMHKDSDQLTTDPTKVTCTHCRVKMARTER